MSSGIAGLTVDPEAVAYCLTGQRAPSRAFGAADAPMDRSWMFALPGYAVREEIHRSRRASVFRATRLSSQRDVVIKLSPLASADPAAAVRFRHEFRLASAISNEHVVSYLALEPCGERVAIVQEDFGGRSLSDLLEAGPLPLATAVELALGVARGLVEIHAHDVIHRAIHPGNLLVRLDARAVKIADFADATFIRQQAEPYARNHGSTMPLAYVSPEQTGRLNRAVDHRTDFYSLGATLYHMIAGRPPFVEEAPIALVHAHIARAPLPLCELDLRVPLTVSRIVDKLLAKNGEDRYQSAAGIVADLAACVRQLAGSGTVSLFPVALADAPERFEVPKRLYGRDTELALLLDAFEETTAGERQLLVVSGYSGVGKSSLVHEVRRPIVERRGLFLAGKFDQLHRNVPYKALRAAFQPLCEELLSEREDVLAAFKERVLARLGPNAALIVELVPDLEKVIGSQPPPPPTGLVEAQNRFTVAVTRFVSVVASADHPVVLFLDDVQWADLASLNVLRALLTSSEVSHLLVIAAYRANEVDRAHPLALALADLARAEVPTREIALRGLSEEDVETLIVDALRAHRRDVRSLSRLVFEKTSGNPFFVDEFLETLAREKLLVFSPESRGFTWDLGRIDELAISANVVDLMLRRLHRLPSDAQEALRMAACLGDRFALSTLAHATGRAMNALRVALEPAIRAHLLAPLDAAYPFAGRDSGDNLAVLPDYGYRFPHDRVRQAAYELIDEAERPAVHLGIGRRLLAQVPAAQRPQRAFDIVDQLARGLTLMDDESERRTLAELCVVAGTRARAANAYHEALAYLRTGMNALPPDAFEVCYELAYALHVKTAECAYLCGLFDAADELSDALLPRLRTPFERAEVYTVRIVLEANRTRYDRSVALGRKALAELGFRVPETLSNAALLGVHAKTRWLLFRKRKADIANLPDLTDPRLSAAVALIEQLFAPAYFMDPKLFFWLIHQCMCISLQHGNAPASSVGYMSYGLLLSAVMGKYGQAEQFGRLGLRLADRYRWIERRAKLHTMFGLFIHHFGDHARKSIEYAQKAVADGLESGDLVYASIASANYAECTAIVGNGLDDVMREAEAGQRFAAPFRHHDVDVMFQLLKQFVRSLRGETEAPASLTTREVDEATLVADVKAAEARIMLAIYLIWKIQLLVMFHRPSEALELAFEYDETIEAMTAGQLRMTEYGYYACLAAIGCLRGRTGDASRARALLKKKMRRLERWAQGSPGNYEHKFLLVSAELSDLSGRLDEAVGLYDRAIHEARAQGYQQNAAFAAELAGRSFERRGRQAIARTYFQQAQSGYQRWGAAGKLRDLEAQHPDLSPHARGSVATESLDLGSVLAATQAISSEIDLAKLLERTLRLIVENAGAERAVLLTLDDGKLRLEAAFDARVKTVQMFDHRPVEGAGLVAESVVRYVARSGEPVVLSDARSEGAYIRDAYVRDRGSRSVACTPLRLKDRTTGVLFLENELTSGAFTTERLGVVGFLVSQVAISLENARLYDATRTLNRALEASEQRLGAFLEGLPVGVFVLERDGTPSFANQKAREIAGCAAGSDHSPAEVFARYALFRSGTDERYPETELPFARALRGESSMVDDVEMLAAGERIPLAIWASPTRDEAGAVRWALVAFQDIAPQRTAEAERVRLEDQLQRAERLESIGRLAGGIAHDFNNLLTPMLVYSEMALRELPGEGRVQKQLGEVRSAAQRAAELTRQLLAFGRMEPGQARTLELDDEIAEFLRMLRRLVRENIAIEHVRGVEPRLVHVDAGQLQRVLMNLAMNAIDAMPRGGTLRLATSLIEGPADEGRWVELCVSDTGLGMDARTLQRVFEPFFTTKEPGKGTGLGLPTVYGLVLEMGGTVRVSSEPGHGSAFHVRLPLVARASGARAVQVATGGVALPLGRAPSEPPRAQTPERTLLVVEDDPAVRSLIVMILEEAGHAVRATGDPEEALELARGLGPTLGLVISDVMMPKMNGLELSRALHGARPGLPVLFVSGYPDEVLSSEGVLEPGVQLLRKPFSSAALGQKVDELLRGAAREA